MVFETFGGSAEKIFAFVFFGLMRFLGGTAAVSVTADLNIVTIAFSTRKSFPLPFLRQVFDLHSGPKPVVFVLHSFLSAKLTRMGLLT